MIIGDHNFQYQSTGIISFDPGLNTKHYEPYWCLMKIDEEIYKYYSWFMNREGEPILKPNTLWGFHASIIKGDVPTKNLDKWGMFQGEQIPFHYGNEIRWSNGRHCWMNLYSERLMEIRDFYGLHINGGKLKYHMTLGRLKNPTVPEPETPTHLIKEGYFDSV